MLEFLTVSKAYECLILRRTREKFIERKKRYVDENF